MNKEEILKITKNFFKVNIDCIRKDYPRLVYIYDLIEAAAKLSERSIKLVHLTTIEKDWLIEQGFEVDRKSTYWEVNW